MRSPREPHVVSDVDARGGGARRAAAALLGGKGARLRRLAELDLTAVTAAEGVATMVPRWYALTTAAFRDTLAAAGLPGRITALLDDLDRGSADGGSPSTGLETASSRIRALIEDCDLPPALVEELRTHHLRLFGADTPVAVRSSAVGEDGGGDSFAGLHESVLAVRGVDSVTAAVKRVWASAWSAPALAYRRARGLPGEAAMAVVVQLLVPARASGVLFTADPVSGDPRRVVIHAVYGLGEGVVEGDLPADRFAVGKESLEVVSEIADKAEQLIADNAGGGKLRRVAVPAGDRRQGAASPAQIRALARLGVALEDAAGRPQDIEVALSAEGEIALLQARPLTTVEEDGPAAGNPIEWDNAAWVENLSGVVAPMTFSVTRRTGNLASRFLIDLLGIERRVVDLHPELFELPLGYVRGRLYLRRGVLVRILDLVPGARFSPRRLAAGLGVRERAPWMDEPIAWRQRWLVELPALLRLVVRSARRLIESPGTSARFEGYAASLYERVAAIDFAELPLHRLLDFYTEMERELVLHWRAPQQNGLYARAFNGLLGRFCRRWCGDHSLASELLRGAAGLRSLAPIHEQMRLARMVQQNPRLGALFAEHEAHELVDLIAADPRHADFAAAVEDHLERYFFKGPEEMKLEAPTWRDRPADLYRALQRWAAEFRPEDLDVEAGQEREREARRQAEERARRALGWRPWRRLVFAWILGHARRGIKNRENLKFIRLQMIGLFRELLNAVGRRLAESGILAAPRDVFYLTLEEILAYYRGQAPSADLRGPVAQRRREIDAYRRDPPERAPGDRFTTWGPVYHRNRYRRRDATPPAAASGGDVLRGTPACRGTASGPVRVLEDPSEDLGGRGSILVIPTVRTAWAAHFPAVAGLLIERGGVLSHTATLAREMGIPTVIGIPGLVAALRSGQRVRIDGGAGTVEILDDAGGIDQREPRDAAG